MTDYILGARKDYEFDKSNLSDQDVALLLRRNQLSILIPVIVEICLTSLWILCAIVPGFALYNGDVSQVSAYTHLGWWLIIEFWCICIGLVTTWFGLSYSNTEGVIEKSVMPTLKWTYAYMFVLAVTLISHAIHAALAIVEVSNCTSTLCTGYKWVLICAIVGWCLWILVNAWTIYRCTVYAANLAMAIGKNRIDMKVTLPRSRKAEEEEYPRGANRADDTLVVPSASKITTPLLAQASGNKKLLLHKLK